MKFFLFITLFSLFLYSCSDTTNGTSDCNVKNCPTNSTCEIRNELAVCLCDDGFEMINDVCVVKNDDPCLGIQCSYHGTCVVQDRVAICDCDDGYYALQLECKRETNLCEVNGSIISCGENGSCDESTGLCVCDSGFFYDEDTKKCEQNVGCLSEENHCADGGNGECKEDIEGDFWCECIEGYHQENNRCVENLCNGKVVCSGALGGCCEEGYSCINGNTCKPLGNNCTTNQNCGENGLCDTVSGQCYCEEDENCGVNQFCDTISGHCLDISNNPNDQCMFEPSYREDLPVLVAWNWDGKDSVLPTYNNVIMPPVVIIFNDDNNDGEVNLKGDTPNVIFSSFESGNFDAEAILRILGGKDGKELFDTTNLPRIDGGSALAVGDLDNDGLNDIVALSANGKKIIVFEYDINNNAVKVKWTQNTEIDQFENDHFGDEVAGAPAIADIDHDGNPEVLVGKYILNGQTGVEKCHSSGLSFGNNSDYPLINGAPTNDDGSYIFPHRRYITVVEDYNNDGFMDIITGNEVISGKPSDNCQVISTAPNNRPDGYTAIADLDNDGIPEVVVVANGKLYIDNGLQFNLVTPFTIDEPFTNWKLNMPIGGAPTIANFDDDPNDLEIAIAGAEYYRVLKPNLTTGNVSVLWEELTTDKSSRQTGSSLFDFDGDGRAEVLYADECYFRIYDGLTGAERFKIENSSATIFEYPIVVDVDGDGKSEVVVPANNYSLPYASNNCDWDNDTYNGNGLHGIRVFEDPDNSWLRTRQIWNQHSYHVTNVAENGKIPQNEEHNWEKYNNYRQNVQGKGVFNAPNLLVENIDVKRENCPNLKYTINIQVTNLGSISVPEGIPVAIYRGFYPNPEELLGVAYTQTALWPGRREVVSFEFTPINPNDTKEYNIYAVIDDEGNGTDLYRECNETDNRKEASFKGAYGLFCNSGKGQCMRFARFVCDADNKLVCGAIPGQAVTEVCDDGLDNDCNGQIDENCNCQAGGEQDCYGGYATNFDNNSRCKKGNMTCIGGESWTTCEADVMPIPEICNGIDDDCNGQTDEIFDIGEDCYSGLGECRVKGSYVCDIETGNQKCNATPLESTSEEICNNNKDDDCDGNVDERPCAE
jgi:hypothetical protein